MKSNKGITTIFCMVFTILLISTSAYGLTSTIHKSFTLKERFSIDDNIISPYLLGINQDNSVYIKFDHNSISENGTNWKFNHIELLIYKDNVKKYIGDLKISIGYIKNPFVDSFTVIKMSNLTLKSKDVKVIPSDITNSTLFKESDKIILDFPEFSIEPELFGYSDIYLNEYRILIEYDYSNTNDYLLPLFYSQKDTGNFIVYDENKITYRQSIANPAISYGYADDSLQPVMIVSNQQTNPFDDTYAYILEHPIEATLYATGIFIGFIIVVYVISKLISTKKRGKKSKSK